MKAIRRIGGVAILVTMVGCGLSPQQKAAKAKLDSGIKSNVTYEKWWPAVSAETANFPVLFADAKREGEASMDKHIQWEVFQVVEQLVNDKKPTHVLRVKYRVPDKEGRPMLNDTLVFLNGTEFVFLWPATFDESLQAVKDWQSKNFP